MKQSTQDRNHALNGLSRCLLQAYALACATYGDEAESFRGLNNEIQDAYMWALADLIAQAREHFKVLREGGMA